EGGGPPGAGGRSDPVLLGVEHELADRADQLIVDHPPGGRRRRTAIAAGVGVVVPLLAAVGPVVHAEPDERGVEGPGQAVAPVRADIGGGGALRREIEAVVAHRVSPCPGSEPESAVASRSTVKLSPETRLSHWGSRREHAEGEAAGGDGFAAGWEALDGQGVV